MPDDDDMLPPLPMRTVGTQLPDYLITLLDGLRRDDPDLPSRSALIREAVSLYIDVRLMPPPITRAILDMVETGRLLLDDDDDDADTIGETQGTA